ncbi:MAG TPA: LytTR family DNA-binding domain-containing protein [Candidatus Didemnitutus sp.]|nr:LytTR family DNA-binding domain-containing protein [Candidatus Didemnitutus sp.]
MTTSKIRTLVVDDEPAARRGLRLLLERDPEIELLAEAASGTEAVARILELKPDLVFLDVQMPELSGFKVLETVGTRHTPAVVFVTAYDQHALRAFEVNAVDYLLKPFEDERFEAAVRRAKAQIQRQQTDTLGAKLNQLLAYLQTVPGSAAAEPRTETITRERILLKSGGDIYFLKSDEIDWIEADGDYMKFYAAGRTHLLRETMGRLEEKLDPQQFIRIHRSTIVNLSRVKKLSPSFAGEYAVILHDGTKLRLSRGYHGRLQELLKDAL